MLRFLAVVIALAGCGGSSPPRVAPLKTADTVAMTDPCDGGEVKEDPCAGGEAKEQVAVADPCDGGEAHGGLGLQGTGEGGGGIGSGPSLGSVGTIGTGSGPGAGKGANRASAVQVTLGAPVVTGRLRAEVIRRIVQKHLGQLRYCYETVLTTHSDLAGALTLAFVITPEGVVAQSKANGVSPELESCVARRAMTWTFPKAKPPVKVTYPMTFALPSR
jgi:hypothetical protein